MKLIYKILSIAAILLTPVAPAGFFGIAVYRSLSDVNQALALIVAICSAVGFESVGIFAGHTMLDAYRQERYEVAGLSAALLAWYVGLGSWELEGIAQVMILIAPAGYVLGGINDALETSNKQATEENILTLRMKQERQLAQIEASKEVKIAELQAQNFVAPVVAPQRNTQQNGNKAAIVQLYQQGVKPADIARQVGVHPSTVTRALQAHSRVSAD